MLLLVAGLGAADLSAGACPYFRTGYDAESCRRLDALPPPTTGVADLPGLAETQDVQGPSEELVCVCEYQLSGSDPRCNMDESREFSRTFPLDPASPVCRRAKSACSAVCPRRLP